ncbi:hypothetical protein [Yinghuangia seranimata]|uniref:hypothetical protein n=1 Tax=Yinghuangia seranimata TaxID=408067 RepID=UPI00248B0D83|nr:hypothetical protein [Yinghuangia seranimata]MDI2129348.1 hypothetical protein [Yinghuangia seranimata]
MASASAIRARLHGATDDGPATLRAYLTVAFMAGCVIVFAAEVYARRWISDDGLIAVRQVKQILEGDGPTYNVGERDEVNTSVLWTWILVAAGWLFGGDLALLAVCVGGLLSVAALAVALDASRGFQRSRGSDALLLPAGALVVLGVIPFWDYGTSGLETGLCLLWAAGSWWLLVRARPEHGTVRRYGTAVVLGLGPLVRPDFALVSAVFLVAMTMLTGVRWRGGLALTGAAALLPVAYEVFRAGYYGILVPMPGLAKEASGSHWDRGFGYFNDFLGTYKLWLPLALFCVLVTHLYGRTRPDRREAVLVAAPIAAALLLCAYVVRVGGDYMHARMWLTPTLLMLLPLLLVPATRPVGVIVALLGLWATVAGVDARTSYRNMTWGPQMITNEREFEAAFFEARHPVNSRDHTTGAWGRYLVPLVEKARRSPVPVLLYMAHSNQTDSDYLTTIPLAPGRGKSLAFFWDNLGMTAAMLKLDEVVVDRNGLATPLAGHLRLDKPGRAGHEKSLPLTWVLAKYADPAAVVALPDDANIDKDAVVAARHALTCGDLKDLVDSTEKPLTAGRFWKNLTGSWDRTRLRVPSDPFEAERTFCGTPQE